MPSGRRDFFVQRGREMVEGRAAYRSLDLSALWARYRDSMRASRLVDTTNPLRYDDSRSWRV